MVPACVATASGGKPPEAAEDVGRSLRSCDVRFRVLRASPGISQPASAESADLGSVSGYLGFRAVVTVNGYPAGRTGGRTVCLCIGVLRATVLICRDEVYAA